MNRITFTSDVLSIIPQAGQLGGISAQNLAFAAERKPIDDRPNYRLGLSAENVDLLWDWRTHLNAPVDLPDILKTVTADITVRLNALPELNPKTIIPLRPETIELDLIHIDWGEIELRASGQLNVDANGLLSGGITFKVKNWQKILTLIKATGHITHEQSETLTRAFTLAAQQNQDPDTLDIPLHITNGQVYLGPLAIISLPQLRL